MAWIVVLLNNIGIYINRNAVIPAWMPESSAMDGNLKTSQELDLA